MIIKLDVDVSVLEERFANPEKRIAYAVSNAINKTALLAQRAVQIMAEDELTIRKREFILREVAILKPMASPTKGRAYAELSIGQKSRLLLPTLETGGSRTGFVGRNVAVPIIGGARPAIEESVPKELQVANLKIRAYRGDKKLRRRARGNHSREFSIHGEFGRVIPPERDNGIQWRGLLGSYLVPEVGIFQRTGRGRSRELYTFVPYVPIPDLLDFVGTVHGVADRNFARFLREEIVSTLEYHGKLRAA